ncbi:MAG TPA: hypothetical protein VH081_04380 [Solirubrobacteraceae bacterium]|jgi:hypothetical protein|nr:hypothetical protein [Solirubrobacteraceae bacterium]
MLQMDKVRPRRRARIVFRVLAMSTTALALVGAGTAGAASSIEGVWSFNGGAIAIEPATAGTYVGTVVTETKFAECGHPVGQPIWTDIRPQPDGSYWGKHQWYFESSGCNLNPVLGLTALRVIKGAGGAHYLRVCLSSPGDPQPAIAADGTVSQAGYGCVNSTPARSETASFRELVTLPSTKKCLSRRSFKIHVHDPRNDAFKTVAIAIRGHRITATRHGSQVVATVNLRGLPRGAFTLTVRGTTVLGHKISGRRVYHTCAPRRSRRSTGRKSSKKG